MTEHCIICDEPGVMTIEHVYPEAIDGSFELENVCKTCNDFMGEHVDCALTNHRMVLLQRFKYKVAGKKGTVPNPLPGTIEDQDGYKSVFETKKDGTSLGFRQLSRVRDLGDGKFEYSVDGVDSDQLLPMVKKHMKRQGAKPLADEQLVASIQTCEKTKTLTYDFDPDLSEYQRPVMKIALGMALAWLGKDYMKDEMAQKIKTFLFDERPVSIIQDEYKINGQVTLYAPVNRSLAIVGMRCGRTMNIFIWDFSIRRLLE
jgi:hypothetical protein